MKTIHIISGILLFLLIAASSASAETAVLTEDNSNVNRDLPGTLPDGIINVQITYNPATGTLTYQDNSPTIGQPRLVNPSIDQVAYNLDMAGTVRQPNWGETSKKTMDGFGTFKNIYVESPDTDRYRTVNVQLNGPLPYPLALPTTEYTVAVHIRFDQAIDANGNVIGTTQANLGSTYLAGSIPEFPTIALPVAAILGLMFIIQRRKEN